MTDNNEQEKRQNVNVDIDIREPVKIKIDTQGARDPKPGEITPEALERVGKAVQKVGDLVKDFYDAQPVGNIISDQPGTAEGLPAEFYQSAVGRRLREMMEGVASIMPFIPALIRDLAGLMPYIQSELEKPVYDGRTFSDIYREGIDPETGEPKPDSLYLKLITDARAARDAKSAREKIPFTDDLGLKTADFLLLLNEDITNDLMRLTMRDFVKDKTGEQLIYETSKGHVYTIKTPGKMHNILTVSTKKILDAGILYLTFTNFYRGSQERVNPTVQIPLIDYGEANGYILTPQKMDTAEEQEKENRRVKERIKELKNNIRRDLTTLENLTWTGVIKKGKNKGDYFNISIISSHSIRDGIIRINFDIDAARCLVNSFVFPYPKVLFKHDNRKPNSYSIGRKIALHNAMDNNYERGTDCTLSVERLLNAAPEIPSINELQSRNQRNWKDKIKKPLESALNDNVEIGLLSKWEYRNTKTGATYTPETAQALTWDQYSVLMVDWTMKAAPPWQTERRAKLADEKETAKTKAAKPKTARKKKSPAAT